MVLAVEDIAAATGLHAALRRQSAVLLAAYADNPRLAAIFGTQQRWLMAHAGLALHFRGGGLHAARFLAAIGAHAVASRNTADAFLQEMLAYAFVRHAPPGRDRRIRLLEPTEASLDAVTAWLVVHLETLDLLDGGARATRVAPAEAVARMQPLIADGLLSSSAVREPERTFSLFTWLNNGGVVMDWLNAGIADDDGLAERVPTGVASIAALAAALNISRTHLSRKLRAAEAMGSIGWMGRRGQSVMWVSRGFRQEFAMAQAVKLAIIDGVFDACFGADGAGRPSQ